MLLEAILSFVFILLSGLYLSWIIIGFLPGTKNKGKIYPVSIIIPAYNEEKCISNTVSSLMKADCDEKEIIVVDDGSIDKTYDIVKRITKENRNLKVIKGCHKGKASAINLGIKYAKNEFIVVLDADTEIDYHSIKKILAPFSDEDVGAVASIILAKNRNSLLNWFQQLEYPLSSAWRYIVDRLDGLCIVPGFCAFRKSALYSVGGLRGDTSVEDFDICMYLRKKGYKIKMSSAIAYTIVPETISGLINQRLRWSIGTLQVIKKHRDMLLNKAHFGSGFYSLPTQIYWFFHALLYVPLVIYQIFDGYLRYYASTSNAFSLDAFLYFFKWLTPYGMAEFIYNVSAGIYQLNFFNIIVILVFALSYVYALFAISKFSRFDTHKLIALFFFFPYVIMILFVYIYSIFLVALRKERGEKWEKGK